MRVGWLSHQFAADRDLPKRPGLLPGRFAGGAEMSTEEMIAAAPDGVEVVRVRLPGPLPTLDFDRLVVGATEHLTPAQAEQVAGHDPVYWVRSPQREWLRSWFREARLLVWPSHEIAADHAWADMPYEVCPAPLDVDAIPRDIPKEDFVLWAGRNIGHKGRDQARAHVAGLGLELVELTDVPRATVLEHMGRARWFVHMPQGFVDPCPRTVIEAEIAGCELLLNDRVGRVPVRGAAEVADYIRQVPGRFWSWVLT